MTVQLLWPVMLHQRLQLWKRKEEKKWKKCWHKNRCPNGASIASNCLWRNYVGDYAWSSLLCMFSIGGTQRAKETRHVRLILAPNRGSLGVLWNYSGSVVVLSWDSTCKNTQTSTQAHTCPVTLTLASLDTNTCGSPRPRIKHTPLHKDIKLTKPYL